MTKTETTLETYIKENLSNAIIKRDDLYYHVHAGNFYTRVYDSGGNLRVERMEIKRLLRRVGLDQNDFIVGEYEEIENLILSTVEKYKQKQASIKENKHRKFIRAAIGGEY